MHLFFHGFIIFVSRMNINHESISKGRYVDESQCYAIMKVESVYCPDCLKWTNQNIGELRKFARYT